MVVTAVTATSHEITVQKRPCFHLKSNYCRHRAPALCTDLNLPFVTNQSFSDKDLFIYFFIWQTLLSALSWWKVLCEWNPFLFIIIVIGYLKCLFVTRLTQTHSLSHMWLVGIWSPSSRLMTACSYCTCRDVGVFVCVCACARACAWDILLPEKQCQPPKPRKIFHHFFGSLSDVISKCRSVIWVHSDPGTVASFGGQMCAGQVVRLNVQNRNVTNTHFPPLCSDPAGLKLHRRSPASSSWSASASPSSTLLPHLLLFSG